MRHISKIFISVCLCILLVCACAGNVFAAEAASSISTNSVVLTSEDIEISEPMTYEETLRFYAEKNNTTIEEATRILGGNSRAAKSQTTRVLTTRVEVTSSYKPTIDFYCYINTDGHYWGITSIYSVQLNRNYNGTIKQFSGNIETYLRSAYEIEYIINGDFYNTGTTSTSNGGGVDIGINGVGNVNYTTSNTETSNYYAYCYDSKVIAFQS